MELYRVDVRTGERKPVASWREPVRVDQAWIAASSGRVFVAAVSSDLAKEMVRVGVTAFDCESGRTLWEKSFQNGHVYAFTADGLAYSAIAK